jgi:CRP/FNR family transcriptional regulator, cyclic AMP receptor protein
VRTQSASSHLASVPLFAGCSKKELAAILKATDEIELADGAALTHQDEQAREAFVLVSGKAVVHRNGRKVAELGPGDSVGELGLLDRGVRTATVVADGPVRVLVIGPREFAALLDEVPSIARKLMQSMSSTIRELDKTSFG